MQTNNYDDCQFSDGFMLTFIKTYHLIQNFWKFQKNPSSVVTIEKVFKFQSETVDII